MRILVVASNIDLPGTHGGSTHVTEIVQHLRARHQVLVLARRGSSGEGVLARGVTGGAPFKHLAALATTLAALPAVRRFAPQVIYERASSFGCGALLGTLLRRPLLLMLLDEQRSPLSLRRADRIIATRPALAPHSVRAKVVRVNWGANAALFSASPQRRAIRERLGLAGATVVGYAGSFRNWHGLEDLVAAAALHPAAGLRYLLVGDGPCRQRVEALIARRGLQRDFILTGEVPYPRVPELLSAAEICVAPYRPDLHPLGRREGVITDPLKLFEYLALGKAAIGHQGPNTAEIFTHGEHLLLVRPGRPAELAAAIARLATDRTFARDIAAAGRRLVLQRYTWEHHVAQLERLLAELHQAPRPPALGQFRGGTR